MPLINYIGNRQECLDNKRGGRGNAPEPIFLDYLVVGGGNYGELAAGGGGGVVSGSIRFLPRFTLDVIVGNGGTGSGLIPAQPSILQSVPNEFFVYAGGGDSSTSGEPQSNPPGNEFENYSQGGAGGSSQSGENAPLVNQGGAGGSGSFWMIDISGSFPLSPQPGIYGGGGGGYGAAVIADQALGGAGGQGGGGRGEGFNLAAENGVNGLGGGGGGIRFNPNTNGGSGVVKLRYPSGSVSGAIGGTIDVANGYVYHTFTGSGQFIYQP